MRQIWMQKYVSTSKSSDQPLTDDPSRHHRLPHKLAGVRWLARCQLGATASKMLHQRRRKKTKTTFHVNTSTCLEGDTPPSNVSHTNVCSCLRPNCRFSHDLVAESEVKECS